MKITLPERLLGIKPLLDQAIPEILTARKNTRQVINKNVDKIVENLG